MVKKKSANQKGLQTEIDILHQIIEIMSVAAGLTDLTQQIAHVLAKKLGGDSCFVYIIENKGLKLVGAWPPHPEQVGKLKLGSGEGVTGWVAKHKKAVSLARDAYKDERFKAFQNVPEDKFEAFLSVPIILKSDTIGVINIFNKKPRVFGLSIIRLLNSIASQIAFAIEKLRFMRTTEKRAKQMEVISKLSSSIVSDSYLAEILNLIVTMTAQMMNSKICSLMLYDDKTKELRIAATQSLSDEYRKKPAIKVGESLSGKALQSKKAVTSIDVTKEPGYTYPEIAVREGLKSMAAVPMLIKDKPVGVINCYTTKEYQFTPEEIDILQMIANQAAIAIENTNLLENFENAKEALESRKVIERAKGLLMKEKQLSEEEAFRFMQKQAMNMRRSMREIAEALILSEGLKGK